MSDKVLVGTGSGRIQTVYRNMPGEDLQCYVSGICGYVTREHWEKVKRFQAFPIPHDLDGEALRQFHAGKHVPELSDRPDAAELKEILTYSEGNIIWTFTLESPDDVTGFSYVRNMAIMGCGGPSYGVVVKDRAREMREWTELMALQFYALHVAVKAVNAMPSDERRKRVAELEPWIEEVT